MAGIPNPNDPGGQQQQQAQQQQQQAQQQQQQQQCLYNDPSVYVKTEYDQGRNCPRNYPTEHFAKLGPQYLSIEGSGLYQTC